MSQPDIYQQMLDANVEIDYHGVSLYVPVNETTKAIVDQYQFKSNVTSFRSAIAPHGTWYDIPFEYTPGWQKPRTLLPSPQHPEG